MVGNRPKLEINCRERHGVPMRYFVGAALILGLVASLKASAWIFDEGYDVGAPHYQYLSWCVDDAVMEYDRKGNTVMKFNCAESNQKCVQEERLLGHIYVVHAYCR